MSDYEILEALCKMSNDLFAIKREIVGRNNFRWKDIANIDKPGATILCRRQENVDLVTAKKMVDDYVGAE